MHNMLFFISLSQIQNNINQILINYEKKYFDERFMDCSICNARIL